MLVWKLAELTGPSVAEVVNPGAGATVTVTLNDQRTARLPLPFDERGTPEELQVASQVAPHVRVLKALLEGAPLFAGHVIRPPYSMVERKVEPAAVCPSDRLVHAQVNNRGDTNFGTGTGVLPAMTNDPDYANVYPNIGPQDQGQIIKRAIDHASPTAAETAAGVPGHGISTTLGSIPASVTRSRVYDTGKTIWEIPVQMAEVEGGPDFALTSLDRTDGILCQLDVFPSGQGTDRSSDVVFEFGTGRDNCANAIWVPEGAGLVNRWMVQGESLENAPPNFYRANQGSSQQVFGIRSGYEARADVSDSFTMQSIARARVARDAFPPDFIEITPALDDGTGRYRDPTSPPGAARFIRRETTYGQPIRVGPGEEHDCWIGDIVGVVLIDRPTVVLETTARIWQVTYTSDEDGRYVAEVKLTPTLSYSGVT